MPDSDANPLSARFTERDHRAEIVDRLYDVALDPIRLEELLHVWEGRAAPLRAGAGAEITRLEDPDVAAHIDRAEVFLDRYQPDLPEDNSHRSLLDEIPRSAAFVADGGARITACNRAARLAFGINDGGPIADLPFEAADIDILRGVLRRVAEGREAKAFTLRLRASGTGNMVIVRVSQVNSDCEPPLALAMSTELVWPEGFEAMVQEAFGLTSAEVDIVRGITLGQQVKDIAEARGRSAETVRTQLRSILAKTETHSQQELVRVVLGLMDVAQLPGTRSPEEGAHPGLEHLPVRMVRGPGGRRLEWLEFGTPHGYPVVYTHLDYGLVRWPARAERAARERGMHVVVPLRAGYGGTAHLPWGTDHLEGVTSDYAVVMDHLDLKSAIFITQGADLRFALNLSLRRPDLVRAVVGCAAQLPLRNPQQYERMDKWQRFVMANARYAPMVLPFIVKAGFSLARKLGPDAFFRTVNGNSPGDIAAFDRDDIRAAILAGAAQALLGSGGQGHMAFAQECLGSERDWSAVAAAARVPTLLLHGDQDPQNPLETMRELLADFPHLEARLLKNTGQLLFFARWSEVLDEVARMRSYAG